MDSSSTGPPKQAPASKNLRTRLKSGAKNLLAMVFGVSLAFVIAEIVLSFFVPPPPKFHYPQPRHLSDPELGWVMRPGQQTFTIDQPVSVNRLGFRGAEITDDKPDGSLRVLCIGDSQTFGNGVAQDKVYASQLEEILSQEWDGGAVEVINVGVQAYDTIQEIRMLERHAPTLRPDIVTVGFYINDIDETRRKNRANAVGAGGEMKRHGLKRFTPYRLIYLVKRSRVVILIRNGFGRAKASNDYSEILNGKTPQELEESWVLIEEQLTAARDLAQAQGFRLIVFPIPMAMEFQQDYPNEDYRSRYIALASRLGIEHFDPTPTIKSDGATFENSFIPWDGHINATTHRLVAEHLARAILVPKTASK